MNKLPLAIALAVVTQATSLEAGVFSFLTGKGRSQGNQVTTSAGSRAEAKVDKNGSIVRVGSNTAAKVSDNGTVTLSKGVMLVSSGEGFLRRPPVQISTPQGDVTVRGSAIVAALPDGSVKMTVLEGNAKGMLGDRSMALNPGQLLIQRHQSRDAVNVNLGALAASSTLLDNSQYQLPLPATPVIRQEVVDQAQSMGATLTLSGANQGGTSQVVTNASDLKLVKNGQVPSPTGAVTVSGGTLQLGNSNSGSTLASSGSLSASNTVTFATGPLNRSTVSPSVAGSSLTVSGSNLVYSPGNTISAVITDSLGNPLPGAGSIRLSQTLVPSGTVLTPTTNSSSTVSNAGMVVMGSSLRFTNASSSIHSGSLVLAPGSTQTGNLTFSSGSVILTSAPVVTNVGTTPTLVKTGVGTLTLSGTTQQVTAGTVTIPGGFTGTTTLGAGSLVLQGAAAQQFLGGTMVVRDINGLVITPTNNGGVLTFQAPGSSTTTTAPAGGN